jgi:hypothetical protein
MNAEGINSSETGQRRAVERFNFVQIKKGAHWRTPEGKAAYFAKLKLWRRFRLGVEYRIENWSFAGDAAMEKALWKVCRRAFEKALAKAKDGSVPRPAHEGYAAPEARRAKGLVLSDRFGYVIEFPAHYGHRVATFEISKLNRQSRTEEARRRKHLTPAERKRMAEEWDTMLEENRRPGDEKLSDDELVRVVRERKARREKKKAKLIEEFINRGLQREDLERGLKAREQAAKQKWMAAKKKSEEDLAKTVKKA